MTEPLPMEINQGEDFTADLLWTDDYDEPVAVEHPCRLDIKTGSGQTFLSLVTDPEIPLGDIPGINVSPEIGLIQLHIPHDQTAAMLPGEYLYDLFVTTGSQDDYAGPQRVRLVHGPVYVNKRITQL